MTEREREKISATPWQKLLVDFLFAGSETKTQIIWRFFFNSNSRPICLLALMCNPVKYLTSQHNNQNLIRLSAAFCGHLEMILNRLWAGCLEIDIAC